MERELDAIAELEPTLDKEGPVKNWSLAISANAVCGLELR